MQLPIIEGYHDVLGWVHERLNKVLDETVVELVKEHVNNPRDPEKAVQELKAKKMDLVMYTSQGKPMETAILVHDHEKPIDGYLIFARHEGGKKILIQRQRMSSEMLDAYYNLKG